ncbi:MAG: hypothetical protein ACRCXT_09710 [Paraclostridium sp.]
MLENGMKVCSCKNTRCIRYGNCKECIEHHKTHSNNKLPHCKRPENVEVAEKLKDLSHIIC